MRVAAVAFDKDGTLVDFERTWTEAMLDALHHVAPDPRLRRRLAEAVGVDLDAARVEADAPTRYLSNREIAELVDGYGDGWAFVDRTTELVTRTVTAATGAGEAVAALHAGGLPLAVVTNDEEASTRSQLAVLGWADLFAVVIGFDSGHGAKPDPGPVRAAAAALGVPVEQLAMVGDTAVDVAAARSAGAIAILVGPHPDPEVVARADRYVSTLSEVVDLLSA